MKITIPSHLSDDDLVAEVKSLALREQTATALLIAHLAELDARRLYLAAGFSSLFTYCTELLGLSEAEAYNRIEAARTARRFPVILDMLGEGSLNLTTVRLLARYLTDENHEALLSEAARKSRRQVEELLAGRFPQPDVAPSVRKLPATTATLSPATPAARVLRATVPSEEASLPIPAAPSAPTRRPMASPLAPDRYEVRFTASAETCEKLRLAQDLLRHAIPSGDLAQIIARSLTLLLEDLARKKFAATHRPRASRGTALGSRDVPAKVRRAVWLRDGGRCAFVGKGGRRCNGRAFVEFHHVDPYGVGGEPTVENVGLRCRAHNAYEAEVFYGRSTQLVLERVPHPSRSPASIAP